MAILDDFKTILERTDPSSLLRIQYGQNGSTFLLPAGVLQQALNVQPVPRVRLRVTSGQLNVRDRPTTAGTIIARFVRDAIIEIDPTTFAEADGFRWAQLYDGSGYVAVDFTTATPLGSPAAQFDPPTWELPFSASQRGLGIDAGGWAPTSEALALAQRNRVEFGLICAYQRGQAAATIDPLRKAGVKNFILRAAISEPVSTPKRYADLAIPVIQEYVQALGPVGDNQILIALHNEPNTAREGFGAAWTDGKTFEAWFLAILSEFRAVFPTAKLGFPALSPTNPDATGPTAEDSFLSGCTNAVALADWVGVHYYWEILGGGDIAVPISKWRRQFGPKLLIATEAGPADNNHVNADAVRRAYAAFEAAGVPACGWVLSGAGAWQNASWLLNRVLL